MEQFERAQVTMLPSKTLSNISLSNKTNNLVFNKNKHDTLSMFTNQHLYITSDDKIKEGDWYIEFDINNLPIFVKKADYNKTNEFSLKPYSNYCRKIIATTDTSLNMIPHPHYYNTMIEKIKDKLPQPSQQFIEKYIESYNKNEVIIDVLIEYEQPFPGNPSIFDCLKVNPKDNTITIKKVKDNWNRKEVINLLKLLEEKIENSMDSDDDGNTFNNINLNEFIKNNL